MAARTLRLVPIALNPDYAFPHYEWVVDSTDPANGNASLLLESYGFRQPVKNVMVPALLSRASHDGVRIVFEPIAS